MDKRKELIVSAIENGTVIDHIPADKVFEVIKILGLEHSKNSVYFGTNLDSKKYGKKGIIKISEKYFDPEDINKIALVAPTASLIEIKDFEVVKKHSIEIPNHIEGKNPSSYLNFKYSVYTHPSVNEKIFLSPSKKYSIPKMLLPQ